MARILLVDDSDFIKDTLGEILENSGHTIVAYASSGTQAISEYEKCLPDLVTMDIILPDIDGIQAIKTIITRYPEAKIIVISASNNTDLIFQALRYGAKNRILKPFSQNDVLNAINEVLNSNID